MQRVTVATAANFIMLQVVDLLHAVELSQPWRSDNDYRDPEFDSAAAAYHILGVIVFNLEV